MGVHAGHRELDSVDLRLRPAVHQYPPRLRHRAAVRARHHGVEIALGELDVEPADELLAAEPAPLDLLPHLGGDLAVQVVEAGQAVLGEPGRVLLEDGLQGLQPDQHARHVDRWIGGVVAEARLLAGRLDVLGQQAVGHGHSRPSPAVVDADRRGRDRRLRPATSHTPQRVRTVVAALCGSSLPRSRM